MTSRRSYLDTLNAGRQRRPHPTLDQISHSLANLESQLGMRREPRFPAPEEPAIPRRAPAGADWLSRDRRAAGRPARDFGTLAQELQGAGEREEGLHAIGALADSLKDLRGDLQRQMQAHLHHEFDSLRQEIAQALHTPKAGPEAADLMHEFARLSQAVETAAADNAGHGEGRGLAALRQEMGEVKAALDELAREETLRSLDGRWAEVDRRMAGMQDQLARAGRTGPAEAAMEALQQRLEDIGQTVARLPDSLSLASLEEKLRLLASSVEQLGSSRLTSANSSLSVIGERLDEISRAIIASSTAAQSSQFDPEPFERIEARISALARQIDQASADRPLLDMAERIEALSTRVSGIAESGRLPEEAIEELGDRLGQRIADIAARIENISEGPAAEQVLSGIEQRFTALSNLLARHQDAAAGQFGEAVADIERRLDEVARRAGSMPDPEQIFAGIDRRFAELAQSLDHRQREAIDKSGSLFRELERRLDDVAEQIDRGAPQAHSAALMEAIEARFSELAEKIMPADGAAPLRELEARLDGISDRLDESMARVSAVDPELVRSLESQVSALSAHLSQPAAPLPGFEDISPRLEEIEKALTGNREAILEAAREAAEKAARDFSGSPDEKEAVAGLAQDLATLEALMRRSDERNTKTFEAIHDTLLKIVDRLGTLERPESQPATVSRKITIERAPSIDGEDDLPDQLPQAGEAPIAHNPRTPTQAAADAAIAALDADEAAARPEGRAGRSMIGGLVKAIGRRKEKAAPQATVAAALSAPAVEIDEPLDPEAANRPLEPGSGVPDINAIIRRVRDERARTQPQQPADPVSTADFIAAARRNAQAAAAEAESLKKKSKESGAARPVKALRVGELFKARRKPVLMAAAAIMLALAGLQLGKAFLNAPEQTASNESLPAIDRSLERSTSTAALEQAAPPAPETAPTVRSVDQAGGAGETGPAKAEQQAAHAEASAMLMAPAAGSAMPLEAASTEISFDAAPAAAQGPAIEVPQEAGPSALRVAAAAGDAKALFEIGARYSEGRGVKTDMAEAAKWYQRSADLGFAPAQYRIGNFYEKGLGVERDIAKAKTWYQLAATQGNASAMHNLGVLFAMGADSTPDNDSAVRWFTKAADLGVKDSQFNLGILAAKGAGMKQDLEESYKWFALVARTGDRDAAAKRDEIAQALRPEQLAEAKARVEDWKPATLDAAANSLAIPDAWEGEATTTAGIDMGKAVKTIQIVLGNNGYDAGPADGVMGAKTKAAIAAFQKANGMAATGEVDGPLVKALLALK